jgi:hypothetical protein
VAVTPTRAGVNRLPVAWPGADEGDEPWDCGGARRVPVTASHEVAAGSRIRARRVVHRALYQNRVLLPPPILVHRSDAFTGSR